MEHIFTRFTDFLLNENTSATSILITSKELAKTIAYINQEVKNSYTLVGGKPDINTLVNLINNTLTTVFVDKKDGLNFATLFSVAKSESRNKFILGNGGRDLLNDVYTSIKKNEPDVAIVVEETRKSKEYFCDVIVYDKKTPDYKKIENKEINPLTHNKILKIYHQ